jgi:hypothetical protein
MIAGNANRFHDPIINTSLRYEAPPRITWTGRAYLYFLL